jgi:hypothetical protein
MVGRPAEGADEEVLEAELDRAAEEMEEQEWLTRRRDAEVRKRPLIEKWVREADEGNSQMLERYEYSRRASFKSSAMKRLIAELSGGAVDDESVIVVRGIAKLFVAELIELASDIRDATDPRSAITPAHITDALNQMPPETSRGARKRSRFWR